MPSWFSKVFKSGPPGQDAPRAPLHNPIYDDLGDDEDDAFPAPRRVLSAPLLMDESEQSGWSPEIRIKAQVNESENSCLFMVDRPVFDGYSYWCPERDAAYAYSPLAAAIFDLGGVQSVLLHEMTVTVTREPGNRQPWEEFARAVGAQIRAHLKSGMPVVHPEVRECMPSEDEIRSRLQAVIDHEINPGIAGHSGYITLERITGNTVYLTMGGGCQGCAASTITLRQGIHTSFRNAVPELGAILDETDHTAGKNPFFKELPAGMGN